MPTLTNRSHKAVARFRACRDGRDPETIFVEGRRLVAELLATEIKPKEVAATPLSGADPQTSPLLDEAVRKGATVHWVTPDLMKYMSDLDTPPGLIVRAQRPAAYSLASLATAGSPPPLLVLLDGLQSPSNVGAVVRTAEAGGATAVGVLPGTADPLSPKSLRASAGSAFRVPLFRVSTVREVLDSFSGPVSLLAADASGSRSYSERDWTTPCVLIMGGEARGVNKKHFDTLRVEGIKIPMAGKVESLNVAVAAGILLMEARRQRQTKNTGSAFA
ncbi:MAG: RNA methyltransferase [Elusimicrobia bacterium]|nr:RNA methyltransferase [Elusimicrobiota bacterium]